LHPSTLFHFLKVAKQCSIAKKLAYTTIAAKFCVRLYACRYDFDIPILALDVVAAGGSVTLAIVDVCPVTPRLNLPQHYTQTMMELQQNFLPGVCACAHVFDVCSTLGAKLVRGSIRGSTTVLQSWMLSNCMHVVGRHRRCNTCAISVSNFVPLSQWCSV
jgi:hypothetical protein